LTNNSQKKGENQLEKYRFPDNPLGTLDPDLEEEDLVTYLEETIINDNPIKGDDYRVYTNPDDLPGGALW
jgi:hypothetical protein